LTHGKKKILQKKKKIAKKKKKKKIAKKKIIKKIRGCDKCLECVKFPYKHDTYHALIDHIF